MRCPWPLFRTALSSSPLELAPILTKILTSDPYKSWPLKTRLSVSDNGLPSSIDNKTKKEQNPWLVLGNNISNQPVSQTCSLVVGPQWSLLVLSGSSWLKWREPCRPWHPPQLSSHRPREWSLRPKPATTCWMKTSGGQGASTNWNM